MLTRRRLTTLAAAFTASILAGDAARGQARYPDQPVRVIIPFPAGGPADIVGRLLAQGLREQLKPSVVVENRAGAGGVVGVDAVAKAPPDGATLGIASSGALSVLPNLMPRMPYDVGRDIQPVSVLVIVPQVLAVHPSVPARSVAELLEVAKRRPGSLNFASAGNGSSLHLAAELFRARAGGIELVHVPYRGAAPALTDLVAGHVQMMFADLPAMLPHIQAGAVRALGVTAATRSPVLPDVPTLAEAGVPGVESETYYGLIAPAGLPADRIATLHAASRTALQDPATRRSVEDQGGRVIGNTPEDFAAHIRAEAAKWSEVIRFSGAKLE